MSPSRTRVSRRLGLLDAMIVVAAIALWLVATRSYAERSKLRSIWYLWGYGVPRILQGQGGYFLMASSMAMLAIRLRPPRPPRRRLWRQPGLAASRGGDRDDPWLPRIPGQLVVLAQSLAGHIHLLARRGPAVRGPWVAGAWLALALTGRWKSEPGSIDRLGRLVRPLACPVRDRRDADEPLDRHHRQPDPEGVPMSRFASTLMIERR